MLIACAMHCSHRARIAGEAGGEGDTAAADPLVDSTTQTPSPPRLEATSGVSSMAVALSSVLVALFVVIAQM